jgi:ferredoxin
MTSCLILPDALAIQVRDGENLLDAMKRNGLSHTFGCRRGGCGVCKVELVEGTTHDDRTVAPTVLSDTEREEGIRLSCRAVPDTDVVVRLRSDDRLKRINPWLFGAVSGRT